MYSPLSVSSLFWMQGASPFPGLAWPDFPSMPAIVRGLLYRAVSRLPMAFRRTGTSRTTGRRTITSGAPRPSRSGNWIRAGALAPTGAPAPIGALRPSRIGVPAQPGVRHQNRTGALRRSSSGAPAQVRARSTCYAPNKMQAADMHI